MRAIQLVITTLVSLLILATCSLSANFASATRLAALGHVAQAPSSVQPASIEEYPIGNPTVTDLWVDPNTGDDDATGVDRTHALRTVNAAWQRIPSGVTLTETGYRIQLVAGDYPESSFPEYWENRHGAAQFPIILQAADEPRTARFQADLNLYNVSYLYLLGLTIQHTYDVFHCERCDHLLLRNSTLIGTRTAAQENIKMNQSQYIYLEENEIDSAAENAVDFVAVHYGHLLRNRIHGADDWCVYLKGGSAHFRLEGNEIYDCGTGGFTAGQGTGFEYMVAPWLHYEAYDLKVVNNVIHDTAGAGLGVNGGYNILLAYNTLYRVGARSHVLEFVFGSRGCDGDAALPGRCAEYLAAGGWGTATVGETEPIPNRNIYVYNNLVYNPAGYQSQWQHLAIQGPRTPGVGSHIPPPARADDQIVIRGNVIWNGPADQPLGINDNTGCQPSNPTCNATQLLADNAINTLEPHLIDPERGDFRPATASNLVSVTTYALPAFPAWDVFTPTVAAGELTNGASVDRNGVTRREPGLPGAYVAADSVPVTPTVPSSTPTPPANATGSAQLYLPAITNNGGGTTPTAPTPRVTPDPTSPPTATATQTVTPTVTATVSPTAPPTATDAVTPLAPGPVTLVMVGDSLTEGQGDDSAEGGGYPRRLLARVQAQRAGSTATNLGKSGWTSTDLIQGLNGAPSQLTAAVSHLNNATGAKVAMVWIGSNDLWYLYEFGDPDAAAEAQNLQTFTTSIATILSQLRATGATVLIALLDDQSQRPVVANPPNPAEPAFPGITAAERQQMSQQVIAYNNAIRSQAAQTGAQVVDFYNTTIFTNPATLADDGNHPNAAGYDAITDRWFAALASQLP